jgi:hypothetical protein
LLGHNIGMPPKRSALKLEQPAAHAEDSDSSSECSEGSYRRTRQCSRSIKESARYFSSLKLEALLCLLVGVSARLSATITTLRFDDADITGNGRDVTDTLRVINGALKALSQSLDNLTAGEGALLDRLNFINHSLVICSRRATLRPKNE